jgi:hypothetical protein
MQYHRRLANPPRVDLMFLEDSRAKASSFTLSRFGRSRTKRRFEMQFDLPSCLLLKPSTLARCSVTPQSVSPARAILCRGLA